MANISKAEYDELIRKKPSLRPTEKAFIHKKVEESFLIPALSPSEIIKAQNTHLVPSREFYEILSSTPKDQEKPLKTPLEAIKSPKLLKFTIPGQPVGKPRQTQSDRWKKRPCVMRYRAWADKARAAVPNGVSLGIYRQISFIAYLELPKSYSKAKRELLTGQPHMQKPDVDNIIKSVGDSLFPEDKFIWKVSGEKRWDDGAGARIEVELR